MSPAPFTLADKLSLTCCCFETQCCLFAYRVVQLLVESGADVNMKDDFSSADRVAFRERVSRLRGEEARGK